MKTDSWRRRKPRVTGGILIDWGSSNVRAYRLNADGTVADRLRAPLGVRDVKPGGFPAAFEQLLGPWSTGGSASRPILMCGMIGSRQGWIEAPYRPCPASLEDLAGALCAVPAMAGAWIVPGVHRSDSGTRHDVLRGEEVQVFGAVAEDAAAERVLCLPGTHSKWVRYRDGSLVDFATAMTGEVFQLLRRHSLLGALMPEAPGGGMLDLAAQSAFRRGVDRSAEAGGLLHHLFGVRAEGLFASIPADGLPAYLSGILIGHEIRGMADLFPAPGRVRLVAEGELARLYTAAFEQVGRACETVDAETATLRGLTRILELAEPQLAATFSL